MISSPSMMSSSSCLSELKNEILEAEATLELWSQIGCESLEILTESWRDWQTKGLEVAEQLNEDYKKNLETQRAMLEVITCHEVVENEVAEWLKVIPTELDALPEDLRLIKQNAQILEKEVRTLKKENVAIYRDTETRASEMRRIESMYSEYTGLTLERPGNATRFVFTKLDPADSRRTFAFNLQLRADNSCRVTQCDPAVAGLEYIISAYNEKHFGLMGLVLAMRSEFKKLVSS